MNLSLKKYEIKGVVQGVGFRPFIVKIANENKLKGWILNDSNGVALEVEGSEQNITIFINEIRNNHPPLAVIDEIILLEEKESSSVYKDFFIKNSVSTSNRQALIAPDSDVCEDCLRELFTPEDRRYRYPFINCTNCGPRYSIIEDIPYDRKNTTMKYFNMCSECRSEYHAISDRRFHAQPVACWNCGPMVELLDKEGNRVSTNDPIIDAVKFLKEGKIIAVKGLGGFHLVADPTNDLVVKELRKRKKRKEKPFALLSENIEAVKKYAVVNNNEEKLLDSKQKPIVILKKRLPEIFPDSVAPFNNNYGVMLAYTPIQYLLLRDNFNVLICTSGNIADLPIEYENESVIRRLGSVVDYFLIHNRDIRTRVDDSIIRSEEKNESSIIRRSRSYSPSPITLFQDFPSGLALGAELKNTICLNRNNKFFLSQHIGDLKNLEIYESFKENIVHLEKILEVTPEYITCDLHPSFYSTRYANEQKDVLVFQVQHHHAHMASCMAENKITSEVIGITFDGVGYGEDGNLWGGEFLVGDYSKYDRMAHFKYFPLLGGDKAVKEPYRIAIALLYEAYKERIHKIDNLEVINKRHEEVKVLIKMAEKSINSPLSCSVGRLFDGVSSLLGVREIVEYEGQAAIELEQIIDEADAIASYSYEIVLASSRYIVDILPMIREIVEDIIRGEKKSIISKRFHDTLITICEDVCGRIRKQNKINEVVLSGGVFQNKYLLKNIKERLVSKKFKVYTHSKVPTNDGGISLGQAVIGAFKYKQHSAI